MPTYTQIGSAVTVGSGGAANIDFTSIPSTYTDLVVVASARTNRTNAQEDSLCISFNGSTANFAVVSLYGDGSTAQTSAFTTNGAIRFVATTDISTTSAFGNSFLYIPNYAGSTNKSFSIDAVTENNATTAWAFLAAGLWSDTAAINRITLTPLVGTSIKQYSTAYLYGVSNA